MPDPLLDIRDLTIGFKSGREVTEVVSRASLTIGRGEVVALVGESGSGKSVTALSIAGLLPGNTARVSGRIDFDGVNLLDASSRAMRDVRGGRIAYVFQEPGTALNPVFTVRYQIAEVLRLHVGRGDHRETVHALLRDVGIDDVERVAKSYPHQISGGQQQRVMIAMALACEPDLLVADEPTTALDVTVQQQILELLASLQQKRGMSVLMITHNLAVAAKLAQRVYVMYAGQIVESGATATVLRGPAHPYSKALLNAVPRLRGRKARLAGIPGVAPSAGAWPGGCRFHPRCAMAVEDCRGAAVELAASREGRTSRCIFWEKVSP